LTEKRGEKKSATCRRDQLLFRDLRRVQEEGKEKRGKGGRKPERGRKNGAGDALLATFSDCPWARRGKKRKMRGKGGKKKALVPSPQLLAFDR